MQFQGLRFRYHLVAAIYGDHIDILRDPQAYDHTADYLLVLFADDECGKTHIESFQSLVIHRVL
ncbi:hypothetical protein SDC9_131937 [bioreactor metagenome]|uniref:Uncharacterized protein n=1 Tax=bioreactor metagenome TaxID=1076179 RepID=A0A645D6H6_9ZZZZ|nr:hypothetical protein AOA81_00240 [Methanomassiliicoccales archaeon RumEn M2]